MSRQVALLEGDVPRHYAAVALDVPLDRTFTYAVPAELADVVVRGARVAVPWRNRARTGIVLDAHTTLDEELPPEKVRPLIDVLDATPMVPEVQLALCEWIARYYHAPIGECVRMATPSEASIRSSRLVTCTDLDAPDSLDETAVALLDVFAAAGRPLPPDEIVGAVRGARHVDLNALEAQGLVASEYVVGESRVRTKTVDIVRFVARDDRHLGAVQKRVVDYVETAGEATDAELRDAVDATRATLRTLARRGIVDIRTEEVLRDPFEGPVRRREADPTLTDEQATAIAEIDEAMAASTGSTVLVHGVTGSGKTELYLRVIRAALAEGRRGLVLLPEIALTPQFVGVFREALGDIIAVLHSGLSPGQRYDQWRRIRRGDVQVVIGARSALFAPLDDIGVVVVDEEHDSSFKQEEGVRYQARDAAIVLAHRLGAVCLLGSATPSASCV